MKTKSKLFLLIALLGSFMGTALAENKSVLIIRGASTHGKDSHNNN